MIDNKIQTFTDLNAWQEAHKLVLMVYKMTKDFPKEEMFGLTNQIRRAAVSITSNIAEGFSRQSPKDVQYIEGDQFAFISNQSVCVHKLINGLIKATRVMVKQ